MTIKQCLIPISVSGERFSTENFLPALRAIAKQYDRAVFLVADTLQLYNRAVTARSSADFGSVFFGNNRSVYLEERRTWLSRLKEELAGTPISLAVWDVKGIDDFASSELASLHRTFSVLFAVDPQFRSLLVDDARRHIAPDAVYAPGAVQWELSFLYLIEEVAINVFLHCVEGLGDEYYLDGVIGSVKALYNGAFSLSALDVCEGLGMTVNQVDFSFYSFDGESLTWLK